MAKNTIDPTNWSLIQWLEYIPAWFWWSAVVFLVAVFSGGWVVRSWLARRKIDHLNDLLEVEQQKPKIQITLDKENIAIGKYIAHFRYGFTKKPFIEPKIIDEMAGWLSDIPGSPN